MSQETSALLLEVKPGELIKFDTEDTFNGNRLEGFLCRRPDHRYGAMVIEYVNEQYEPQIVWATPKLHYPFDRAGNYKWPLVDKVEVYEKLDGTNILSYHYGVGDQVFTSFKIRLNAVVKDTRFGLFRSMLQEYISENEWVVKTIKQNPEYNLSFELYGNRNPITIKYSCPLEMALLFGVDNSGMIIPPTRLTYEEAKIPLRIEGRMLRQNHLTGFYNALRADMSKSNTDALSIEGMVFYAKTSAGWQMFKCKPEEIEKIHWTASGHIPKASIWTTVLNAFESYENPTVENVLELLREEYPEDLLTKNTIRIEKLYNEGLKHAELVSKANEVWGRAAQEGLDVTQDKDATMRFISQYFDKDTMRKVAHVILKQAGLRMEKPLKNTKTKI